MIPSLENLLLSLPDELLTEEIIKSVKDKYDQEIENMKYYIEKAKQPNFELSLFEKQGSQYISEFYVNDLKIQKQDTFNWHCQNTSQWLYAGCILIDNNEVSTHH